jgi:hypothetical protein
MMKRVSHYHYEIYQCQPVLIISTIHQRVPQLVINMYHKKVHQPCTNLYQTTFNHRVPTSSTIHLMYVSMHQLLVSTMYSTCTSTKILHQFHHPNLICNSLIDLVYMTTYLQMILNFNNKRLAFSSNFTLVSHD